MRIHILLLCAAIWLVALGSAPYAWGEETVGQTEAASPKDSKELGFKVGKLRLHPGFSVQDIFDSNVSNSSGKGSSKVNYDDILRLLGAFRMNYPGEMVAFTFDGGISYARYFGIDNKDTIAMSSLVGDVRFGLSLFPNGVFGASLSDSFNRSADVKQVGIVNDDDATNGRMHNTAELRLAVRPGGGQLRLFFGYRHGMELYENKSRDNLTYMDHTVFLDWELEFLPKTAVFMTNTFTIRDYWKFDSSKNDSISSKEPSAMPLRSLVGIMGRVTSKLLINAAVGYGNSFSEHYTSYNMILGKLELTGQFTPSTSLKGGFERTFEVIPSFSYQADNKIYLEFKQWFLNDSLKLNLYGGFSIIQFGKPDKGIDIDERVNIDPATQKEKADSIRRLPSRDLEYMITVTPSFSYNFLAWLALEIGYNFNYRDTPYSYTMVFADPKDKSKKLMEQPYYFNYMKHEAFLKLTLAY